MAKGKKTGGRDWVKGQVPNPIGARAHDPQKKALRKLTHAQVAEVASLILDGDIDALNEVVKDKTSTPLKIWLASVAMKGIQKGDMATLSMLLDRVVGKVKEKVDLSNDDGSMKPTFIFETVPRGTKD